MPINMSYCRARNTLEALRELYDSDIDITKMDDEEVKALKRLVKLCRQFADDFEDIADAVKAEAQAAIKAAEEGE